MRKIFLPILLLLGVKALAKPAIITGYVFSSYAKPLSELLLEDAGLPQKMVFNRQFLRKVKGNNPHIRDFQNIQSYERIYLELPYGTKIARAKKPRPAITTGFVTPAQTKSLRSILKNDARLPEKLLKDPKFLELTKQMNPKIQDFAKISASEKVYLEIPYGTKLAKGTTFMEAPNITEMEYRPEKRKKKKMDWTLSAFYMASQGAFNESIDGIEAQSNQDSPATLGASGLINLKQETFYSGSFYISHLDPALVNNETSVEIPPEYGATSYINWQKGWPVIPYGGVDIERFSTLNLAQMEEGAEASTREHLFLYATAGISKTFSLMNRTILFKGSVSQSVWSQSSPKGDDSKLYSGNKYILFLATKLVENWSANFMVKQHFMTGPSELNITRVGAGVGYTFF